MCDLSLLWEHIDRYNLTEDDYIDISSFTFWEGFRGD